MDLEPNLSQTARSFWLILKLMIFICKQLKRPVAFSTVHFDIKLQIFVLQNNFFNPKLHLTMKVSVPKDFGNTSKKPVLPLAPESIKIIKKEDLATAVICSGPLDHAATQVKCTFKTLDGDSKTPREMLGWRCNVEQTLRGLNLTASTAQHNMTMQFMWGSALSRQL